MMVLAGFFLALVVIVVLLFILGLAHIVAGILFAVIKKLHRVRWLQFVFYTVALLCFAPTIWLVIQRLIQYIPE